MKTSYILLIIIALLTLSGMVATDVLLKQQYKKIDWQNIYQDFEKRDLPLVNHWVIEGSPTNEILVQESKQKPQALVSPDFVKFYRIQQQGDTAFVHFTPDYSGGQPEPHDDADHQLGVVLVLRVPDMQTLQVKTARLTIANLTVDKIQIGLQNTRLRTEKVTVTDAVTLTESHNSYTRFGSDQLQSLQVTLQDSSGLKLSDTHVNALQLQTSTKSAVSLDGRALTWLKK